MRHHQRGFAVSLLTGLISVVAVASPASAAGVPAPAASPNILFILADNLGCGELGAYGGGETRGAPTSRLDRLAGEGLSLANMNTGTQCTPSRSSLMTGRFAIRSGAYAVPFRGLPAGLTQWEMTIAESLSAAGYATALHGKWHLGSHDGRLPNDQGSDERFGIPRTTDGSLWPVSTGYSPDIVPVEKIMERRKGGKSKGLVDHDITQRRLVDANITRRSIPSMERQVGAGKTFFTTSRSAQRCFIRWHSESSSLSAAVAPRWPSDTLTACRL